MVNVQSLKEKIYNTFSETASSIGYSSIHGKIIGALLANEKEMSLQDLANETGYSISMISLSLDLLEVFGLVKKVRKIGDRNLYIYLQGDLLECLKNAITIRVQKSISNTLMEFQEERKNIERLPKKDREKMLKIIEALENQIKRLQKYVNTLSKVKLPK